MKKFMQKKLKNEKGMTLIELLAVIVILAIIAAIAIPAISGIIENSRVGAIKSDAQNIMSAGELYFIDEQNASGNYSVSLHDLETKGFIDDSGSFDDLNEAGKKAVTVVKEGTTPTKFTGTGTTGGIQVAFSSATRDNIAAYANSDRGAVTDVPGVTASKVTKK